MTKPLYLEDTYLFICKAHIISQNTDSTGDYVILDQTIFYPQGGGQPSDQGIIRGDDFELNIISVRQVEHEIRHYLRNLSTIILKDLPVICSLDTNRRLVNARFHTAAHLLGNIIETMYPSFKVIKGHSFPQESYIEFQISESSNTFQPQDNMSITIQNAIDLAISSDHKIKIFHIDPYSFEKKFYKLPYQITNDRIFRVMQLGNYAPMPCGGTHLSSTKEIGNLQIGKIKVKKNTLRISYEVL